MYSKHMNSCVAMLCLAAPGLAQTVNFNAPRTFSSGGNPNAGNPELCMSVADFNGDGKPDLVWRTVEEYITVLLGNGDGTFRTLPSIYFGHYVNCLTVGDFNGDGKPDLAVLLGGPQQGPSGRTVSILLGNGDGTFQPQSVYQNLECAQVPIVGDYNRDGILDFAVPYCGGVAILLGHGDGTFNFLNSYPTPGYYHGITADFNRDGKLDLALADSGVSVLLGNGDGSFGLSHEYQAGGFSTTVATGDVNRDGTLDLVTSNYDENNVSILLGNGDGTFRTHVDYATGNNPVAVIVADFNGDGKLDLAVAIPAPGDQGPGAVSILLGNGDGTFRPRVDYPTSAGAIRIDVGDFNQDGKLDLAVSTVGPSVDILLGNGDGTFQPALSFPTGGRPWNPVAADFNGDGHLDVATGNFDDGTISVLLQTAPVKLH